MKIMHQYLLLVASMLIVNSSFCSSAPQKKPKEISSMTFFEQYAIGLAFGAMLNGAGMTSNSLWTIPATVFAFGVAEGSRQYAKRNKKNYWRKIGGEIVGVVSAGYLCAVGIDKAVQSPTMSSVIGQCDKIAATGLNILPKSQTLLNWNKSYHLGAAAVSLGGIAGIGFVEKRIPNYNKPGFWIDGVVGQTFDEHFLD